MPSEFRMGLSKKTTKIRIRIMVRFDIFLRKPGSWTPDELVWPLTRGGPLYDDGGGPSLLGRYWAGIESGVDSRPLRSPKALSSLLDMPPKGSSLAIGFPLTK